VAVTVAAAAAVFTSSAAASQLLDRDAKSPTLSVNGRGEALVTYLKEGSVKHVLAWGAENAISPTRSRPQVAFELDYAGGWGKYRRDYWKTFANSCSAYDGALLAWLVTACKAPDGSYWALQAWQRGLPDYGVRPTATQAAWELRLSHWSGELPVLSVTTDWAWHRWDHLFGMYSYVGNPVFGFKATATGAPLDSFARNVYLDTFDSRYGQGWKRENSFLTHTHTGGFCYSVNPHGDHPAGNGTKYRATIEGPGVTPDVLWEGPAPGAYNRQLDAVANAAERQLDDPHCPLN
jgi:hypothetical protein